MLFFGIFVLGLMMATRKLYSYMPSRVINPVHQSVQDGRPSWAARGMLIVLLLAYAYIIGVSFFA